MLFAGWFRGVDAMLISEIVLEFGCKIDLLNSKRDNNFILRRLFRGVCDLVMHVRGDV